MQSLAYTADADRLAALLTIMAGLSSDLTEVEYAWLLFAYHRIGDQQAIWRVFRQLHEHAGLLHEPCLRVIAAIFASDKAASWLQPGGGLGGSGGRWSVRYTVVDDQGRALDGTALRRRLLTDAEWSDF